MRGEHTDLSQSIDIKTIISRYAEYHAERTAIVCGDDRLTFRAVNERSIRLANGLRKVGVNKDDRIGTLLGNCPQYIEGMFAKHKISAVDVILSPRTSTDDLEYQIHDAEIHTLIADNRYIPNLPERSKLPGVKNFISLSNGPLESSQSPLISSSSLTVIRTTSVGTPLRMARRLSLKHAM